MESIAQLEHRVPILNDLRSGKDVLWTNPELGSKAISGTGRKYKREDMEDAARRLERFAPLIEACFPETIPAKGKIESDLTAIPGMQETLNLKYGASVDGRLLLKQDNALPISGSIKDRSGVYEILHHAETTAQLLGLLNPEDLRGGKASTEAYARLAREDYRRFFGERLIQVGSTGNLAMSVGIMGTALGFDVTVHMAADSQAWKKDFLRARSVNVLEHRGDHDEAVGIGRRLSALNPSSYFVDDENSEDLFLGASPAALHLQKQLEEQGIIVDEEHPLFVYIPCGVGGASGGICFGLKQVFGDAVHCFFAEPTLSPCMLVGLATGLQDGVSVQDAGLSGSTRADGLSVGRCCGLAAEAIRPYLSGICTVSDGRLYDYMRDLKKKEGIFLEPSACAGFRGPIALCSTNAGMRYLSDHNLHDVMPNATHIVWGTGGKLMPDSVRFTCEQTYL